MSHDANPYPTPDSEQSKASSPPPASEPVAAKLERLSSAVVRAINARDFEFRSKEGQEVVAHLTDDWKANIDTARVGSGEVNWKQQVAAWKARVDEYPEVYFQILDCSSTVDERKGQASVYLNMKVSGVENIVLHAMNELRWKRYGDDTWLCYYTIGMRGSTANSGGY